MISILCKRPARTFFAAWPVLIFLALSGGANAESPPAPNVNTLASPWSLVFHLAENQRSPSGEKTATTHLELSDDGKFKATRAETTPGSAPRSRDLEGVLSQEELAFLVQSLAMLDMKVLGAQKLDIGYGATLHPGWEGSLVLNQRNQPTEVGFTSLRSKDDASRSPQMNRLVTVVFDLKRVVDQRFNTE